MPAGWNVRVTTFDSEGKPRLVRNFVAYESDKDRAVELVPKRVPVQQGPWTVLRESAVRARRSEPRVSVP
jgi:hypothetical protein